MKKKPFSEEERTASLFAINDLTYLSQARKKIIILVWALFLIIHVVTAQRKMENLGRGVVAIRATATQAFISWRLLGTEPNNLGFNLYRQTGSTTVKLNSTPLTGGTNWQDNNANLSLANAYYVRTVINGIEQPASASFVLRANASVDPYFSIPLQNLPGYSVKFIWVGDLDGDGEYDFVFDRQPADAANTIVVEAYKRDGTFLWRVDCGLNSLNRYNIEPGSSAIDIGHGDGITVYDINNDGRAEVLLKTSNGVRFGNGAVLTNSDNNRQFISVLQGTTGIEIARAPVPNGFISEGPLNGHFGIAYLDGINPSLVFSAKNRNTDNSFNMIVTTWTWSGGSLTQNWTWVRPSGNIPDGHNIRCIDLDGDGKDEIFPMGYALRPNGTLLYSLGTHGIVHGDRFHIGDLDPNHPGVEGYVIQQDNPSGLAWAYFDGATGNILQSQTLTGINDLARGMAGDLDPRYAGYEFYTFTDGLYNVSGARTSTALPNSYPNMRHWWDGDVLSENLDNGKFTKWDYVNSGELRLYTASGVAQVGPKTPGFYGDILGDWREEVVYTSVDQQSIRVYTTPIPTTVRLYTLAHNPAYRNCMTVKGYYQSNMVDYYLGQGMSTPPAPNITLVNANIQGRYVITARHSGKALDVNGASTANGGDVIQWTTNGQDNQQWDIASIGGSYVSIMNVNSGKAMEVVNASGSNGANIAQYDYSGGAHQQWQITPLGTGHYSIINRATGKAVDIAGASSADGADVLQWTYTGAVNQQFIFSPVSQSGLVATNAARLSGTSSENINSRQALVLYPNPSSTEFQVKASGAFSYRLYDNAGKLLKQGRSSNSLVIGKNLLPGL